MHIDSYDIVGDRFNRLVVLREMSRRRYDRFWLCRCDCGNEKVVRGDRLRNGVTKSCGCLTADKARERATHNMTDSPEYVVWCGIKRRTLRPNNWNFKYYGARGITMCERWQHSFESFYQDVGPRPTASHTLHRLCEDRGYEPGNVKWAGRIEQANNKRNNRLLTMNGRTHTLTEWARITGKTVSSIQSRLSRGWSVDDALTKPNTPYSQRKWRKKA